MTKARCKFETHDSIVDFLKIYQAEQMVSRRLGGSGRP